MTAALCTPRARAVSSRVNSTHAALPRSELMCMLSQVLALRQPLHSTTCDGQLCKISNCNAVYPHSAHAYGSLHASQPPAWLEKGWHTAYDLRQGNWHHCNHPVLGMPLRDSRYWLCICNQESRGLTWLVTAFEGCGVLEGLESPLGRRCVHHYGGMM